MEAARPAPPMNSNDTLGMTMPAIAIPRVQMMRNMTDHCKGAHLPLPKWTEC